MKKSIGLGETTAVLERRGFWTRDKSVLHMQHEIVRPCSRKKGAELGNSRRVIGRERQKRMKLRWHSMGVAALLALVSFPQLGVAQENVARAKERIGVYDSRAVAVAFAGSPAHEKQLRALIEEHRKAKETGDLKKASRLEAEGKALQVKAHKQAFSTAPVDDILAHITNALPGIQRAAGVTALISKWDKAELKKHAGAERVDVTMQLVDAFQPKERQRKSAIEIQKRRPISLKQAERIKD